MEDLFNAKYLVNAVVYSLIGLGVLAGGFMIFDRFTPGNLWKEIVEEQNIAVAILFGAMAIAIAQIIASAIHG